METASFGALFLKRTNNTIPFVQIMLKVCLSQS